MDKVTASTAEATELSGPVRTISLTRMLAFSGGPLDAPNWPSANLHTNKEKAAEAGLAAPIASGLQYQGDLVRFLMDLLGDDWSRSGKLHVKFPRVVAVGDEVRPKVRITTKQQAGSAITFELEVWCENQDQDKVLVGTASCSLAADS